MTAKCQHCGKDIRPAAPPRDGPSGAEQRWETDDGFMTCIKTGMHGFGVQHKPMPPGLRGSPEGEKT